MVGTGDSGMGSAEWGQRNGVNGMGSAGWGMGPAGWRQRDGVSGVGGRKRLVLCVNRVEMRRMLKDDCVRGKVGKTE